MRIFTLTMAPVNPPYDDGVKNLAIHLARRIRGHHFYLVSSLFGRSFPAEENITFMRSIFQKKGKHSMSLCQKVYVFLLMFLSIRKIDLFQFFITPQLYFSSVFSKLLKKNNKRSIQIVSSVYTLYEKNRNKEIIPKLFFADKVVVYSDFAKQELEALEVKNVIRIYPGIDTKRFSPNVECQTPNTEPRIIYPGTYKVLKTGYSFGKFCSIAQRVVKDRPNVNFVMACRLRTKEDKVLREGFVFAVQKAGIMERFTFLDTVEDMPELFRSCDVGIMPLERPAPGVLEIPMVLPEIAAMGKPVVYGNVAPLDELAKMGVGVMAEDSLPETYSTTILEFLTDVQLSRDTGERSRQIVVDHFNIDRMSHEYEKLYRSLGEVEYGN